MRLVKPKFEILDISGMHNESGPLELIEIAGRTCYKSESKITKDSSAEFVKKINNLGHLSVIEHSLMSVRFIVDRGVSHEIVRHRLCAFSQESTRYVNYKNECTFIIPPWINISEGQYNKNDYIEGDEDVLMWLGSIFESEESYKTLISLNWSPQKARTVLPNSTKTEIVVTANFREWQHILKIRCSKAAHPQMREIMIPLHIECKKLIPIIFNDIKY